MPKRRSRKNLRKLSRKNSRRISKKLSRKNSLKRKNLKRSRKNKKLRGGSSGVVTADCDGNCFKVEAKGTEPNTYTVTQLQLPPTTFREKFIASEIERNTPMGRVLAKKKAGSQNI